MLGTTAIQRVIGLVRELVQGGEGVARNLSLDLDPSISQEIQERLGFLFVVAVSHRFLRGHLFQPCVAPILTVDNRSSNNRAHA